MAALDPNDNGYASRKFWLTVASMGAIMASAAIAAGWPSFGANLQTTIGGILAALGIYAGANVTNSWLTGKNIVQQGQAAPTPDIQDPPTTKSKPSTAPAPKADGECC